MFKLLIASVLLAYAVAVPAGPPPHPGPGYHEPNYAPRPYAYEYGVKDEYSGVNFGAHEESDGKAVVGSYTVLLPDGRTQLVKYTADHYAGYVADVSYSGHAAPYAPPVHKPAPYHPAPVHAPIPIHAAPIHHG